jgi:hypothetical protein
VSQLLQNGPEITALLIAPDRQLAQKFLETLPQTRGFQILADLKSYPQAETLEIGSRGGGGTGALHRVPESAGSCRGSAHP